MSAAACKVAINAETRDTAESLINATFAFDQLSDTYPSIKRNELWFKRAIEIDRKVTAAMREAVQAYWKLGTEMGEAVD